MKKHTELFGLLALGGLLAATGICASDRQAGTINAAQIAAGGGRGAAACVSCHGPAGEGNPAAGFPRLAGLPADYLQRQLGNFANGQRQNATMLPIAKALSADEARSLARYYAQLPTPRASPTAVAAPSAGASGTGRMLAERGRWDDNLPACSQCHGNGGSGVGANFPPLAGQPSVYLSNQLQAWQKGTRDAGPLGLMGAIAKRLSAADVHAVADYFSQLPALSAEPKP